MKTISISKLKPYPGNPRSITEPQLKALCKLIEDNKDLMDKNPIQVNSRWQILAGNHRLLALQSMGLTEIPLNWVEKVKPENEHLYSVVHNVHNGEFGESTNGKIKTIKSGAPRMPADGYLMKVRFTSEEYEYLQAVMAQHDMTPEEWLYKTLKEYM